MDKRVTWVLSGMIAVILIMIVVALVPFANSVFVDDGSEVIDSESSSGESRQVLVVGDELVYTGVRCRASQVYGEGHCSYPLNQEKRCYREITVGCNTRLSEVSCYEGYEQVRGEGHCFSIPQVKKRCYDSRVVGCNEIVTETSCFKQVDQIRAGGSCDYIEGFRSSVDTRERRGICG